MQILLGNFSDKVGKYTFFNQEIGNENLHELINDDDIRVANLPMSENLTI
jgi:hypothetical protein